MSFANCCKVARIFLTILILTFVSHRASAQIFHRGYIIKDGNKINGYIRFKGKKKKEYILFKTTKKESPQKFTPDQVSEFYLNQYQTRFFPIQEKNSGNLIFTEIILEGTVNLYSRDNLYILKKDTTKLQITLPLSKIMYRDEKEAYSKKRLEVVTRGSVMNFLKDCKDLKMDQINISNLKKTVGKYNECTNQSTPLPKQKGGFVFNLTGGLNISYTKFTGDDDYFYKDMKFDPSIGYVAGVGITFGSDRFISFMTGNVQVLYNNQEYNGKASIRDESSLYTEHREATIKNSTLRIPMSLRRYFSPGHQGIFIELGGTPYFTRNFESYGHFYGEYDNGTQGPSGTVKNIFGENRSGLMFFGSVGYAKTIGKLKLAGSLKFEYGNGSAFNYQSVQKILNTGINFSIGI